MIKPAKKACEMTTAELASYIDYSVLKPEFTKEQIIDLTKDGVNLGCATICINPGYLDLCEPYVKGSKTMLCPVCDFPFGTSSTESRIRQIEIAARYDTVKEVDIVSNFGKVRGGNYDEVLEDLKQCVEACHKLGKPIKVIFETDCLDYDQVRKMVNICIEAKADFVKSSTGFLTGYEAKGATEELIGIMLEEANDRIKVKGSGCIRTQERFFNLIDMGIDRMGVGYKSVPVVLGLNR